MPDSTLLERVRAEYLEMQGLRLTLVRRNGCWSGTHALRDGV